MKAARVIKVTPSNLIRSPQIIDVSNCRLVVEMPTAHNIKPRKNIAIKPMIVYRSLVHLEPLELEMTKQHLSCCIVDNFHRLFIVARTNPWGK